MENNNNDIVKSYINEHIKLINEKIKEESNIQEVIDLKKQILSIKDSNDKLKKEMFRLKTEVSLLKETNSKLNEEEVFLFQTYKKLKNWNILNNDSLPSKIISYDISLKSIQEISKFYNF